MIGHRLQFAFRTVEPSGFRGLFRFLARQFRFLKRFLKSSGLAKGELALNHQITAETRLMLAITVSKNGDPSLSGLGTCDLKASFSYLDAAIYILFIRRIHLRIGFFIHSGLQVRRLWPVDCKPLNTLSELLTESGLVPSVTVQKLETRNIFKISYIQHKNSMLARNFSGWHMPCI